MKRPFQLPHSVEGGMLLDMPHAAYRVTDGRCALVNYDAASPDPQLARLVLT